MLTIIDPDEYETVTESTVCSYHEANPGVPYAGCGCSVWMGSRRRPQEEILRLKAERNRKHEDAVLREAETILRSRATATIRRKRLEK